MAQLKTDKPVRIKCAHCGDIIQVAILATAGPDPEGLIYDIMRKGLAEKALCPPCQGRYNYLASVGRSSEFHFNPEINNDKAL